MNADSKLNGDRIAPLNENIDEMELPTEAEIHHHMIELEQRGKTVDLECYQCGSTVEKTVLPEDETQATMCRDCAEAHLRSEGFL